MQAAISGGSDLLVEDEKRPPEGPVAGEFHRGTTEPESGPQLQFAISVLASWKLK